MFCNKNSARSLNQIRLSLLLILSTPLHFVTNEFLYITAATVKMSLPGQVSEDSNAKPMKAARYYGKEEIQIKDDIPRPTCGDGQVKIEPAFVGICGTDLHEYMGGPT